MNRPRLFFIGIAVSLLLMAACGGIEGTSTPASQTPTTEPLITDRSGALVILSHSAYSGSASLYHIVGELKNTSNTNMGTIKVIATLYDETGQIIGVGSSLTLADVVTPGSITPFDVELYDQGIPLTYQLQIEGFMTDRKQLKGLEIISHSLIKKSLGDVSIVGEVKNNRSIQTDYVRIIATFYDADDRVVGADYTYAEFRHIPPGGSSPFNIWLFDKISFDHYELMISD
jgi:hypothetical protein